MYRIFIIFLFASIISSCYNSEKPAEVIPNTSETEILPNRNVEKVASDSSITPKSVKKVAEGKIVTYENATSYAAATDYTFFDEENKLIFVRVNHFEDAKSPNPIIPDNMKESTENIEGPPGANPEMVGKKFKLMYDGKNVTEVIFLGE